MKKSSVLFLLVATSCAYGWKYRIINRSGVPISYEIIYFTYFCSDDRGIVQDGEDFYAEPGECRLKKIIIGMPSERKRFEDSFILSMISAEDWPDPAFVVFKDRIEINRNVTSDLPEKQKKIVQFEGY